MSNPSKLRAAFANPPKTGAGQGGPTMIANSMGALPKPDCHSRAGHFRGDSGQTLKEKREAREYENMSPEKRSEKMMTDWNVVPPPPTGPAAQTSLRESFERGEEASRKGIMHSGRVEQPEFRNYDRGRIAAQEAGDISGAGPYDLAAAASGDPHGKV